MEPGGVIKRVGNSKDNKTGAWRVFKPVITTKCTGCGICVQFCPEGCMELKSKRAVIDYDYCKGCLICLNECPVKAIEKEQEVR